MAQWYYSVDGVQQGPVEEDEVRAMLASRTIHSGSLVWTEGMEHWQALGQVPYWKAQVATPAGMPMAGQAPVSQTNGLAIASLVCGLVSLPMMVGCWIGIVTGIPAVICGHMALSQLKRMPFQAGRGMALTGLITGYLAIGITLLAVAAIGIAIARDIS